MAGQRPMIIQTQFGTGPQPHGAAPHHRGNIHRSPSHDHRAGLGRRYEDDRSPMRSGSRRVPPQAPEAPPAYEYNTNRELMRRRRSTSPSTGDLRTGTTALIRGGLHDVVEYHDLRDHGHVTQLSESEARKRLTTYIAVRLKKRDTSDERDTLGRAVPQTWRMAEHRRVHGMGAEEILDRIRLLDETKGRVAQRRQDLSDSIEEQLDSAYRSLDMKEQDRRFCYRLAQFDRKRIKLDRSELENDLYPGKSSKKRDSSSKRKHTSMYWDERGKSTERSKSSKQKVKQTVSVTAYFRREPKPHTDCQQLLLELAERDDREDEYDERFDERHTGERYDDEYDDEYDEEDDYSNEPSPRPRNNMPFRADAAQGPIPVPPQHQQQHPAGQPQYAQPRPQGFPQQQGGNYGPNAPAQPNMNGPMGGPQGQPGGFPHPQPGPGPAFGNNPNMPHRPVSRGPQFVPQQHGPPHGPPPHGPPQHGHGPPQPGPPQPGPPQHGPPQHGPPHQGPPQHMPPQHGAPQHGAPQHGPPQGPHQNGQPPPPLPRGGPPQMGAPGGPPGPHQGPHGQVPGGPPPPRGGPPPAEGVRPGGHPGVHQGVHQNQAHQPRPQPVRFPNNGMNSPRSSTQDSFDRDYWSDEDDNQSTGPSSIDPASPQRKHAEYKAGHFGIPPQLHRKPSRPYIEDDEPPVRRPSHGRASRSPSPSRHRGERQYEKKLREGAPAPRVVHGGRAPIPRGPRRDDDISDVEGRMRRMRVDDDRRERDRQDHRRRRSSDRSWGRGDRSRTPERRHRGESSYRDSYESRFPARRHEDSRERSRHSGGSRWRSPERDRSNNYGPRYRDGSPQGNRYGRHRGDDSYSRR